MLAEECEVAVSMVRQETGQAMVIAWEPPHPGPPIDERGKPRVNGRGTPSKIPSPLGILC